MTLWNYCVSCEDPLMGSKGSKYLVWWDNVIGRNKSYDGWKQETFIVILQRELKSIEAPRGYFTGIQETHMKYK